MSRVDELLGSLRRGLVPVASGTEEGVCHICHGASGFGYEACLQCREAHSFDPPEVLPIAMSVQGGLLHNHLWGYKNDRKSDVRARKNLRLSALVSVFMENHGDCVGNWDYVCCVPSEPRVAPAQILAPVSVFRARSKQVLVTARDAGRALDITRFGVRGRISGDKVLLFDDTFTSGASLFSAASVLRSSGAEVVGPLVIGRYVRRSWEPSKALLGWLAGRSWDSARCVRCDAERKVPDALF